MKKFFQVILWLLDAAELKYRKRHSDDIEERLKRIENKLDKSFPLGLATAGLPFLALGLSDIIDKVIKLVPIQSTSILSYSLGGVLLSIAIGLFSDRIKYAIISVLVIFGILIALQILNTVSTQ